MKTVAYEKTRCPTCKSRCTRVWKKWTAGHITSRKHECQACGELFLSHDYGERPTVKMLVR
jgi:transcriptional regulator NrdR family protein